MDIVDHNLSREWRRLMRAEHGLFWRFSGWEWWMYIVFGILMIILGFLVFMLIYCLIHCKNERHPIEWWIKKICQGVMAGCGVYIVIMAIVDGEISEAIAFAVIVGIAYLVFKSIWGSIDHGRNRDDP